ncbi:MAG: AlpA family phage regulatory protein [Pseudomonadota bacterium]
MANDYYWRIWDVSARTGLCKSTIYDMMAKGEFPLARQLTASGSSVGWLSSEVNEWMANRRRIGTGASS